MILVSQWSTLKKIVVKNPRIFQCCYYTYVICRLQVAAAFFVGVQITKHPLDIIEVLFSVDKKNQLDVTFCILYFSSNSCSTCFGQPCAHHQELTTA